MFYLERKEKKKKKKKEKKHMWLCGDAAENREIQNWFIKYVCKIMNTTLLCIVNVSGVWFISIIRFAVFQAFFFLFEPFETPLDSRRISTTTNGHRSSNGESRVCRERIFWKKKKTGKVEKTSTKKILSIKIGDAYLTDTRPSLAS